MSQALYRKWRPHLWEDVVGQGHVIQTLRNAVAAQRFSHAYLFAGPRGTGKTTTARLLAKALNCLGEDVTGRPCDQCENCQAVNQGRFLDLIEIDAASNTSVEDVRDLREKIGFSPNAGQYKVYIVDEVHMLSTAAFNALLKTLEEPPKHAVFILATTEVHKIPATVLSRCQRYEFRRIPVQDIEAYLARMAESEGIKIQPGVLTLVARQATGAMRDAISLLDQLASTGKKVTLEMANEVLGTATSQAVLDLVDALVARQAARGLDVLQATLDAGSDPRQFARQVVDYLRNLLLVRVQTGGSVDVTPEVRAKMAQHSQAFSVAELLHFLQSFNQAASEGRTSWMPSLPLEMAFVQALEQPQPVAEHSPAPSSPPSEKAPAARSGNTGRKSSQPTVEPPPQLEESPSVLYQDEPMDPQSARLLEDNWKTILNLTRQQNPNTYGLLNSCKSRHLKDAILTLGFASDVLKFQMEKSGNMDVVLGVLQQVFEQEISIRCVTLAGKRSTPPPGVDSDGMVASALRDLGGEIVDVR
jgi:DNA polymerase III subunit gamma/tau